MALGNRTLFACLGGQIVLPGEGSLLLDRADGGHLRVEPPRPVWERSELSPDELAQWSFLIAASGAAMLQTLPQLEGGCVNYWEASNWSLHDDAEPAGVKEVRAHRRMHMHLLGRSRTATDPHWKWGEAPHFPRFDARLEASVGLRRLTAAECAAVILRLAGLLRSRYDVSTADIQTSSACPTCGYPFPGRSESARCADCAVEHRVRPSPADHSSP
ncbi:MAG: hypothetical protein ABI609_02980 [Acidobacteriota bacterium]